MAWYQRFWNVLRPARMEKDLERELSFHVAERAEELEAAGMSKAEAWRSARRSFGNYTAQVESTRDIDTSAWADSLTRNLRQAVRALRKSPAFAATVILTLALGIGANSAVFSAIYAVLLRPLPFPMPDGWSRCRRSIPSRPAGLSRPSGSKNGIDSTRPSRRSPAPTPRTTRNSPANYLKNSSMLS